MIFGRYDAWVFSPIKFYSLLPRSCRWSPEFLGVLGGAPVQTVSVVGLHPVPLWLRFSLDHPHSRNLLFESSHRDLTNPLRDHLLDPVRDLDAVAKGDGLGPDRDFGAEIIRQRRVRST